MGLKAEVLESEIFPVDMEIEDDLLDGIRGIGGSPIRYDERSSS